MAGPAGGRNIFVAQEDLLASLPRQRNHFIRSGGRTADAQAGVALGDEAARNRMENFVERGVANALRSGRLDER